MKNTTVQKQTESKTQANMFTYRRSLLNRNDILFWPTAPPSSSLGNLVQLFQCAIALETYRPLALPAWQVQGVLKHCQPFMIHRFHATRPLASNMTGVTTFQLDVSNRTSINASVRAWLFAVHCLSVTDALRYGTQAQEWRDVFYTRRPIHVHALSSWKFWPIYTCSMMPVSS